MIITFLANQPAYLSIVYGWIDSKKDTDLSWFEFVVSFGESVNKKTSCLDMYVYTS